MKKQSYLVLTAVVLCSLAGVGVGCFLFKSKQEDQKKALDIQERRSHATEAGDGETAVVLALQMIQEAGSNQAVQEVVLNRSMQEAALNQPVQKIVSNQAVQEEAMNQTIQETQSNQTMQEDNSRQQNLQEEVRQSVPEQENLTDEIQHTTTNVEYFSPCLIQADIFARIQGLSYKDNCKIPLEELRYIKVLHIGFDGQQKEGELIVNRRIAEDICEIFRELYEARYPIEKIRLVDEYGADDNRSMADNNSSAFNYRVIEGTERLSNHAKGFAIDINPLYNPYIRSRNGEQLVLPDNAYEYADRTREHPHYITKGDICYQIFRAHGFTWGGEWNSSKDYQHFEKVLE